MEDAVVRNAALSLEFLNQLDLHARDRLLEQLSTRDIISLRAASKAGRRFVDENAAFGAQHPVHAVFLGPSAARPELFSSLLACISKLNRCTAVAISVLGGPFPLALDGFGPRPDACWAGASLSRVHHLVLHADEDADPKAVSELRAALSRAPAPSPGACGAAAEPVVAGLPGWGPFSEYTLHVRPRRWTGGSGGDAADGRGGRGGGAGGASSQGPSPPALLLADLMRSVTRLFPQLQSLELYGHWALAAPPQPAPTQKQQDQPQQQPQQQHQEERSSAPEAPPEQQKPLAVLANGLPRLQKLALPAVLIDSPQALQASGLAALGRAGAINARSSGGAGSDGCSSSCMGGGSHAGGSSSSGRGGRCVLQQLVVKTDHTRRDQRTRMGWAEAVLAALPGLQRLTLEGGYSRLWQLLQPPQLPANAAPATAGSGGAAGGAVGAVAAGAAGGPGAVAATAAPLEQLNLVHHMTFTPEPLAVDDLRLDLRAGRLALAGAAVNAGRLVDLMQLAERAAAAAAAAAAEAEAEVAADAAAEATVPAAAKTAVTVAAAAGAGDHHSSSSSSSSSSPRAGGGGGGGWCGSLRRVDVDTLFLNRAPRAEHWAYLEGWAEQVAAAAAAAEGTAVGGLESGKGLARAGIGGLSSLARGSGSGCQGDVAGRGLRAGLVVTRVMATFPECGGGGGGGPQQQQQQQQQQGTLQRILRLCARGSVQRVVLRVPWVLRYHPQQQQQQQQQQQPAAAVEAVHASARGGGGGTQAQEGQAWQEEQPGAIMLRAAIDDLSAMAARGCAPPPELGLDIKEEVSDELEKQMNAGGKFRAEVLERACLQMRRELHALLVRELRRAGLDGAMAIRHDDGGWPSAMKLEGSLRN